MYSSTSRGSGSSEKVERFIPDPCQSIISGYAFDAKEGKAYSSLEPLVE